VSSQETSLPLELYPAYELAMALACPRLLAKAPRLPSQDEVLQKLNEALAFAGHANASAGREDHDRLAQAARPHLIGLRDACGSWAPGREAPPPLKLAARALLVSGFGFAEPAEGWEDFDLEASGDGGNDE
jgi:hypothetical protein